jgi:hypothetical protein
MYFFVDVEIFKMSKTENLLPEPDFEYILQDIVNNKEVGKSTKSVEIRFGGRKMTDGEIAMATELFKDAIDYDKVRIHAHTWKSWQKKNVAITPDGTMYFHQDKYIQDFSKSRNPKEPNNMQDKQWFMHEMVHIWQHQLGYELVTPKNALTAALPALRSYTLEPNKRLKNYNMEEQGNILSDYWLAKFQGRQNFLSEEKYRPLSSNFLTLVELVLTDFLKNRKDPSNLPG